MMKKKNCTNSDYRRDLIVGTETYSFIHTITHMLLIHHTPPPSGKRVPRSAGIGNFHVKEANEKFSEID